MVINYEFYAVAMKTKANGGGPNTKPFNSRDMSLVTISESVIAHLYSTMSEGVSFSSSSIHEYDLDPWPRPVVSALNCCASSSSSSSPLSFDSQDFSMYKTTILICSSLFIILAATYFLLLLFDGLISLSLSLSPYPFYFRQTRIRIKKDQKEHQSL